MSRKNYTSDVEAVDDLVKSYHVLRNEIAKVIVGQDEVVKNVLVSIFSAGHCLLIGVPGLAKTLLVNTVAQVLGLSYNRIQFTPDLMPSDIIGTEILDEHRQFRFVKGPLFAHIILADEINRTPPKTQAALLEAMQERAVTAAGKRYPLDNPFFVLATQNPIEQEGTYPLPEAQLDRFMFSVWLNYPSFDEEMQVVKNTTSDYQPALTKILGADEIVGFQNLIKRIPVPENVMRFAVTVASRTRPGSPLASGLAGEYLSWGAGPRASQYLVTGAKCHAVFSGKYTPDMEDVRAVAPSILRHRIVRNYKAEAEGITEEAIMADLLKEPA